MLAIILMTALAVRVYTQQYDLESNYMIDWDQNVKDGVIITKYLGTKKEVRIPPSIQNYPVTAIGNKAFYENKIFISVTIPDSVTSIGRLAFFDCTNLTSITFQGTIASDNLNSSAFGDSSYNYGYIGDLRAKYLASDGGPGTYRRLANGSTWRKQ